MKNGPNSTSFSLNKGSLPSSNSNIQTKTHMQVDYGPENLGNCRLSNQGNFFQMLSIKKVFTRKKMVLRSQTCKVAHSNFRNNHQTKQSFET